MFSHFCILLLSHDVSPFCIFVTQALVPARYQPRDGHWTPTPKRRNTKGNFRGSTQAVYGCIMVPRGVESFRNILGTCVSTWMTPLWYPDCAPVCASWFLLIYSWWAACHKQLNCGWNLMPECQTYAAGHGKFASFNHLQPSWNV